MTMLKEHNGKWSSKRVWGTVLLTSALIMTLCDGLDNYEVNERLVEMMFITGTAVLGIGVFKK